MGCASCRWMGKFSVLLPHDSGSESGVLDAGTQGPVLAKASALV